MIRRMTKKTEKIRMIKKRIRKMKERVTMARTMMTKMIEAAKKNNRVKKDKSLL